MLEGRLETLHGGANCFAVYGKEETLAGFIEYLKNKVPQPFDIRIVGGLDSLGRIKIIITGSITDHMSFDAFHLDILNHYTRINQI